MDILDSYIIGVKYVRRYVQNTSYACTYVRTRTCIDVNPSFMQYIYMVIEPVMRVCMYIYVCVKFNAACMHICVYMKLDAALRCN